MNDQQRFHDKQWSQIVAMAWADEEFKDRLMSNPKAVLREYGLEIGPGVRVDVVEDTESVRTFVLPPNPANDLEEEELSAVGVGYCYCGSCRRCGCGHCGCGGCGCGCVA